MSKQTFHDCIYKRRFDAYQKFMDEMSSGFRDLVIFCMGEECCEITCYNDTAGLCDDEWESCNVCGDYYCEECKTEYFPNVQSEESDFPECLKCRINKKIKL